MLQKGGENRWTVLSHVYLGTSKYDSLYHTNISQNTRIFFFTLDPWASNHPLASSGLNQTLFVWTLTHFHSACDVHLHGMEIVNPAFPGIIFTVHVLLNYSDFSVRVMHRKLENPGRRSTTVGISERYSIIQ